MVAGLALGARVQVGSWGGPGGTNLGAILYLYGE